MAEEQVNAQAAAIAAIWERAREQTLERLDLLQRAADELSTSRSIEPDLRQTALTIAHKLAGSLGMFGYSESTEHARAIEMNLAHDGLPQPERLQQQVAALRASLAGALDDD